MAKPKDNQMTLRLPPEIEQWLKGFSRRGGFKTRQKAIIDILSDRKHLEERRMAEDVDRDRRRK